MKAELQALREQVLWLQRERLVKEAVVDRKLGKVLQRYVQALSHVLDVTGAPGRAPFGEGSRGGDGSEKPIPSSRPVWADNLLRRHERWLLRQVDDVEAWLDKPYATREGAVCERCGKGLARGWRHCPSCGTRRK